LSGWNAVDSNPNKASYFKSKEECILYVAKKLKQNYLTKGGAYFDGYTAKDIDKHYCSDKEHANKIIKIVNKLKNKI
jgi:beta-N-acetylglucosaminidase